MMVVVVAAAAAAVNSSGGNASCLSYVGRDQAVSNGVLQGDNPTHFALPLLIIQIAVVLATTRSMAFLIKPFHQPRVLAEVIGGVLLGPSGLGRNAAYLEAVFPKPSLTMIDTVSTLGLLFFLFMVGLELDLKEIRKCGRNAVLTALSGVAVPFVAGVGVSSLIHRTISSPSAKFGPLVVFVGVPISITAFPVLVRIMAERKLLGTELGKIVLPAAAINDVCAWVLLAVGVALAGPSSSPATPAYVLLLGLAYVVFMLVVARRVMVRIAHRASGEGSVKEIYVCVTMVAVLVAGFTTDAIGIHPLFGAFVFGLVVPKEGRFAQMLTEKIEDFVTVLMLPLFFASSGLKTNLGSIDSAMAVGLLALLVVTATVGKISATVTAALLMKMDLRKGFAFGFLMNTKGLVELIVLNIGKDIGVLDDQTFAILVLTCLIILFFTTPAVMALYKPARNPLPYLNRKLEGKDGKRVADAELRVLACVHGTKPIPAFVNLVEALSKGTCNDSNTKKQIMKKKKGLKIFAMHLLELSDRPSSIMSLSRDTNGHDEDPVLVAFQGYARFSAVRTKLLRVVSELNDMHEDVCNTASEKRATIIIMPFNIYLKDDGWSIENINQGFSVVNQRVLQHAPCSVGILVDRGQEWGSAQLSSSPPYNIVHVGVAFFGGPDDREALAFACLLAEHPSLEVYVMRFVKSNGGPSDNELLPCVVNVGDIDDSCSLGLDEQALSLVKKHVRVVYEEHGYNDDEEVRSAMVRVVITRTKEFALVLVGKSGHKWDIEKGVESSNSSGELGAMGDALASAHIKSSFLVIQQHRSPTLSNHKT